MKLSNISIIFIIIIIPIILVLSYYISLQIDTINMQTAYSTKQLEATKEAIEAFEINTVEWNEAYSENADSKRRDIMASINTFTTSFANSLGIGGTNRENLEVYIPAIACTLYDGYYIYAPSEVKSVIKDEDGVAVFLTERLVKSEDSPIVLHDNYEDEHEGKLLYEYDSSIEGARPDGTYNGTLFTLNSAYAKLTYEHILKPFSTYSARYNNGKSGSEKIDITVNYTLDNYITIYGTVKGEYVVKSGYLILPREDLELASEELTEKIAWRWNEDDAYICQTYPYVYAEDNTKVYFEEIEKTDEEGNKYIDYTSFQVSSSGVRTNLNNTTEIKYKKVRENSWDVVYQALNTGIINKKNADGEVETLTIEQGKLYRDKKGREAENLQENIEIIIDYSVRNYYIESTDFTEWVKKNLSDITIGDMQDVDEPSIYGNENDKIFDIQGINPEREDSVINIHKREVIKQTLISNLNQAITSYSRNSEGEYNLPILTETDWDHILRNVSIVTFVQNIPIGMKYYNNYAIATSTENKEYTNPDEIYLTRSGDNYYHLPYCEHLSNDTSIIGYKNIDYVVKSYEDNYYYKHSNIANEACYYCLVQRDLYSSHEENTQEWNAHDKAYKIALARERYRNISEINLIDRLEHSIQVTFDENYEEGNIYTKLVAFQGEYGKGEPEGWPEPDRTGYYFMGWYTDEGEKVERDEIVTKEYDHTLYAKWDPKPCTIAYDANGGTAEDGTSTWTDTVTYGEPYKVKSNWYQRTGYSFTNWNEKQDGTGKVWNAEVTQNWNNAEYVTLYAQWTPNKYTVTFNPNGEGGTVSPADKEATYSTAYGDLPTPEREGHTFNGWFTAASGGTQITSYTIVTTASNHEIYAQWTKETYTITYDANGGSGAPSAETKTYGEDLTLSSQAPTLSGYDFLGWSTDSSATSASYSAGGTFTTNANTTLYAVWKKQNIAVTSIELNKTGDHWIPLKNNGSDGTLSITATVKPSDATNKTVTWTSSNPAVASVSGGTVTAKGAGYTKITAKAGEKTASVNVYVYNAVMKQGTSYWLRYSNGSQSSGTLVAGTGGTKLAISWKGSNLWYINYMTNYSYNSWGTVGSYLQASSTLNSYFINYGAY